ncbi:molybdopterin-binding protein [Sulfoacidibacillus thermotolerans]|nr:molybdopterin-binding protein [Sulfoacidibacillus thermotolerans]
MKREVRVQDAVGMALAHDLTQIVPGQFKGRLFTKGHIIQEEDIAVLLSIGKEHVYVLSLEPGEVHEDDAARRMAHALVHESLTFTEPHEGKITVKAAHDGLLVIDVQALQKINEIGELVVVTKRTHIPVKAGATLAGLRAIPLVIHEEKLAEYDRVLASTQSLIRVVPFKPMKVGVVTTGSEVFKGRITDRFGPVLREKFDAYTSVQFMGQQIVDDQTASIIDAIQSFMAKGADLILVTGGMSVDPDDRSPGAIAQVATNVVSYGMPILPGSMSMLAYCGDVILLGLPGAVIYDAVTAFDLLLPLILAGQRLTRADIAAFGHGGLL